MFECLPCHMFPARSSRRFLRQPYGTCVYVAPIPNPSKNVAFPRFNGSSLSFFLLDDIQHHLIESRPDIKMLSTYSSGSTAPLFKLYKHGSAVRLLSSPYCNFSLWLTELFPWCLLIVLRERHGLYGGSGIFNLQLLGESLYALAV